MRRLTDNAHKLFKNPVKKWECYPKFPSAFLNISELVKKIVKPGFLVLQVAKKKIKQVSWETGDHLASGFN